MPTESTVRPDRPPGRRPSRAWIGALLVVAAFSLAARQAADDTPFRLALDDGAYTFEVDEQGGNLLQFVELVGPALGVTFRFERGDLAGERIDMFGTLTFPEDDLIAFVETVLDGSGINMVGISFGGAGYTELLARRRLIHRLQNGRQDMATWAPLVELTELEQWRHRRALISAVIPLEQVDADRVLSSLNGIVDNQLGIVAALQPNNLLFVVERADVVCRIVDLIRELDVPGHPDGLALAYEVRQHALQSEVTSLDERVLVLEETP